MKKKYLSSLHSHAKTILFLFIIGLIAGMCAGFAQGIAEMSVYKTQNIILRYTIGSAAFGSIYGIFEVYVKKILTHTLRIDIPRLFILMFTGTIAGILGGAAQGISEMIFYSETLSTLTKFMIGNAAFGCIYQTIEDCSKAYYKIK